MHHLALGHAATVYTFDKHLGDLAVGDTLAAFKLTGATEWCHESTPAVDAVAVLAVVRLVTRVLHFISVINFVIDLLFNGDFAL